MDWLADPLVLARFVNLAACALVAGLAVFIVLSADLPAATDGLHECWRRIVRIGAAVAALSGVAWLAIVAANILGTSVADACLHGGLWSVTSGTQFGHLAVARLVLALLLILPVWTDRLRLALALALIVLIAPAGHAGAQAGAEGWVHLVADAAHLLAAAAWLGGLPALAMYLGAVERDPQRQGETAARLTARFSWLGIACVGTLIASGLINSWFLLSGPADLLSTTYGRVLALKLALFAAMLAIATANRFYLTPRLRHQSAARSLRRNSLIEVCLGAGVLLLVAILGTLEPGVHHHDAGSVPEDAAFVHIHTSLVMADVTVEPGRPGLAEVRIHLSREDFGSYPARAVRAELRPPEGTKAPIVRDAKQTGDGIWKIGDVDLAEGGIWTIVLSVVPKQGDATVLDGPIVISP